MKRQKQFALSLLEFHGGGNSSLYAVGSCMLSAAERGDVYNFHNYGGHDKALPQAIQELRNLKKNANFPECVTPKLERDANKLANRLENVYLNKQLDAGK